MEDWGKFPKPVISQRQTDRVNKASLTLIFRIAGGRGVIISMGSDFRVPWQVLKITAAKDDNM